MGSIGDDENFFRDEIVDGAVYRVNLKKIRYNSSFNQPFYEDETKARLRWKLEERRTIKVGTLTRIVESLCLPINGDLDSISLDIFLTTYQTFTTASELLHTIIDWYEKISGHLHKENCKKSLKHVLLVWLTKYEGDFHDPPSFPALFSLHSFVQNHFPDTDLFLATNERMKLLLQDDDDDGDEARKELFDGTEMMSEMMERICKNFTPQMTPPLDIFNIPSSYFAEQLTFVDSMLFCRVVPRHCLGSMWSRRNDKKLPTSSRPCSVLMTVEQFNAVSYRVISTILKWPYAGVSCRTGLLGKWISIAQECRRLKNFSSLKAILAGLQSNSVFRLKKIWQALSKEKMEIYDDLATIFSSENNQAMWREVLLKEGTAKSAEVEIWSVDTKTTNNTLVNNNNNNNKLFGNKKKTNTQPSLVAQKGPAPILGTVPYLGTFLTDLTMLDTAFPDVDPDTSFINFDKKRKEFEVLAQIQILQSSCNFYSITPDPSFLDWFYRIRTYDENECHELSMEIEPSLDTISKNNNNKGHKKNLSLGYFTIKRSSLDDDMSLDVSSCVSTADRRSVQSLREMPALSKILSSQVDTLSFISTRTTLSDLTHHRIPSNIQVNLDKIQAKVELICDQSHDTNFYKSILISNQDHVSTVLKKILLKFSVGVEPDDFRLSQRLENGKEIDLPDRGNAFYALKLSNNVRLIVRPKGRGRSKSKSKHRGLSAVPLDRKQPDSNKLTRIFNSMISLVPS